MPPERPVSRSRNNQWEPDKEEQMVWNWGKEKKKLLHLSPCWFNFYAEHILENAGLEETQAEIKRKNKNINNFRYADDTTDIASSKE